MLTAIPVACTEAGRRLVPQGVDEETTPHPTPPQHSHCNLLGLDSEQSSTCLPPAGPHWVGKKEVSRESC